LGMSNVRLDDFVLKNTMNGELAVTVTVLAEGNLKTLLLKHVYYVTSS
jgi:hypothetical protein